MSHCILSSTLAAGSTTSQFHHLSDSLSELDHQSFPNSPVRKNPSTQRNASPPPPELRPAPPIAFVRWAAAQGGHYLPHVCLLIRVGEIRVIRQLRRDPWTSTSGRLPGKPCISDRCSPRLAEG